MIIGAGIVGMATGKGLAKKGNRVTFIDNRRSVIDKLRGEGYSACSPDYCEHLDVDVDVSMFCVDTPLSINDGASRYPNIDLSHLTSAVTTHAIWMRRNRANPYHLVVIRSTVPPGTTTDKIVPILEKVSCLKIGIDFGVCMQPEFLRSRVAEDDFMHPRIIVIGEYDKRSGDCFTRSTLGSMVIR
jgi:UDPglucose 6-dehydrogenase